MSVQPGVELEKTSLYSDFKVQTSFLSRGSFHRKSFSSSSRSVHSCCISGGSAGSWIECMLGGGSSNTSMMSGLTSSPVVNHHHYPEDACGAGLMLLQAVWDDEILPKPLLWGGQLDGGLGALSH